ncbi:right-handed parallel beta-helix repeat-containing protein [Oscillospiraceae bacterium CM]|nr:right-handed parallel beta-helix repeat-containing protein [Oscillospiraceae bacterium CM]
MNGKKLRKTAVVILAAVLTAGLLGFNTLAAKNAPNTAKAAATAPAAAVDVTSYGAKGTDRTDDTAAIQKALNSSQNVYIPGGTYYINVDVSLKLRSNQTLKLADNAILQALPTASANYSVLDISGVTGVTVTGGKIVGDRDNHSGTGGEWGMGILIENGANNVAVTNITITNCWGDGLYLGGGTAVTNIRLEGVTADNNRRQGLSITNATGVTVTNSTFKNTQGTAPEAGIDLEPNEGQVVANVTITNTVCTDNAGSGLEIMGWLERIKDVTVTGGNMSDNNDAGIYIENAENLRFNGTTVSNNYTGINIPRDAANVTFENMTVNNNRDRGVSLVTTYQQTGVNNIVFTACVFTNNSAAAANNVDGVRVDNYDGTQTITNVFFNGCTFSNTLADKTQRFGLTVGFSGGMNTVVLGSGCVFKANVSGDYLGGDALTVA